ncbi:MAG TPA: peptidyl-prolyl cis-trans isomerase [Bacilli bacterium]|nr:peptidyl-prolyl cis-trans isomerase [Bacilli bacterium]
MEFIMLIKGNVEHPLTIDPSVWIFDERKVDMNTYFLEKNVEEDDELTKYTKAISAQWDKELIEGSEPPNPNSNDNKILLNKQELTTGSFGMVFEPFLLNARPKSDAKTVRIETSNGEIHRFSIDDAKKLVLAFSKNGKPLRKNGPVHVYHGDGSNQSSPITDVTAFIVE